MFTCSLTQNPPRREKNLLLIIRIVLEKVQALGKEFPWKKPRGCPSCGGIRLWGHGYVLRYFHNFSQGLWLKRYRCPECGAVHTVRPIEYSPGFQYPWETIRISLEQKQGGGIFLPEVSRQCQQYWLKAYRFQLKRIKHDIRYQPVPKSQKQVTFRLFYHEMTFSSQSPYLPFAVTTRPLRI